jgi:hypothetical protein
MATLNRGILGGIKGKIGNVVGSSWKGISTLKSLPLSVANPRTAGQVAQRTKMTAVVAVGQILASTTIETFFQRLAVKMSGFNLFVKTNIAAFDSLGALIAENFKISYGKLLEVVWTSSVADDSANTITLVWDGREGTGNALAGDLVEVVWYNVDQDYWKSSYVGVARSVDTAVLSDTTMVAGDELLIYLAIRRADYSLFSNTQVDQITVQA